MEKIFYHITLALLSVTIFITHVRILRNGRYSDVMYLCLPTKGRGHIDFGADPVGVCFGVAAGVVGVTVGYVIVGGF